MARRPTPEITWRDCAKRLKQSSTAELVGLLHDLYRLSDENRQFIQIRVTPYAASRIFADTRRQLREMLSVSEVINDYFRHIEVKRLIDGFPKATGDSAAIADLLVTDLETSYKTFSKVGDDRTIVDHIYATMRRLDKVLSELPARDSAPLVDRLSALASRWAGLVVAVALPVLIAVAAIVILSIRWTVSARRWRRSLERERLGLCAECGYDIRNCDDRCSRCGAKIWRSVSRQ